MMPQNESHVGIRKVRGANLYGFCQSKGENFFCFFCSVTVESKIKQYVRVEKNAFHLFNRY